MRIQGDWMNRAAGVLVALTCLSAGCLSSREDPDTDFPLEEPRIHAGIILGINVISGGSGQEVVKEVSAGGELTLALVGTVKCEGLMLQELTEKLKKAYGQYFHDAQVTVRFVYGENIKSPWGTALVMGAVARPGPVNIPPTRDLTVTRALQLAGGATALGDKTAIRITRKLPGDKTRKIKLDLEEIGKKGQPEKDIILRPDDVVYVPEIFW
jgi:protein involved in polysaccharide export with SLBB domain